MGKKGKSLSLLEEIEQRERAVDERAYLDMVNHPCHHCEFSTWVGTGYYCPFHKCFQEDPFYMRWVEMRKMRSEMQHGKAEGS
jgi:hypothetical protein